VSLSCTFGNAIEQFRAANAERFPQKNGRSSDATFGSLFAAPAASLREIKYA